MMDELRITRLALATTVAVALSYAVAWPLAYITPLFVWNYLKLPTRFGPREAISNLIAPACGCLLGLATSIGAVHYPVLFILLTTLLLWLIFYQNGRGISADFVLWLIIGITLIPMLALQSQGLTGEIIRGLLSSAFVAVLLAFTAHLVLPEQSRAKDEQSVKECRTTSESEHMRAATISTIIVMPVIVLFYSFNLVDKILIMIFIAITAQAADLAAGKMIGTVLMVSNLIGGAVAIIIYNILVIVPEYSFLLILILGSSLLFASRTFSTARFAPLFGMAFTTTLLLVGSATLPYGGEVDVKFITRVLQVLMVSLYIVAALKIMAIVTVKEPVEVTEKVIEEIR